MIRTLVFHIGDPKNGSSSIQSAIWTEACTCPGLVLAPQEELNASALANAIIPDRNPENREREFGRKARWVAETDADLGLISAEFFSAADPGALLDALRAFLPDHADTARIVAYVRPHAGQILSSYAQGIKSGVVFGADLATYVARRSGAGAFFYAPRFERWRAVFGDRFTLRPFICSELRDGDVVADFFHTVLQGAEFTLDRPEIVNESMTVEELAGMRVVQSALTARGVEPFLRLSIGGAVARELSQLPGRSGNRLVLDRANAGRIMEIYREDARRMDTQFFGAALMEPALTEAVESAAPEAPALAARAYYSPAQIRHLRLLARDVAALVKRRPQAWRLSYQIGIGQHVVDEVEPLSVEQTDNANAVWKRLAGIVAILTGEQPPAAGRPGKKRPGRGPKGRKQQP